MGLQGTKQETGEHVKKQKINTGETIKVKAEKKSKTFSK